MVQSVKPKELCNAQLSAFPNTSWLGRHKVALLVAAGLAGSAGAVYYLGVPKCVTDLGDQICSFRNKENAPEFAKNLLGKACPPKVIASEQPEVGQPKTETAQDNSWVSEDKVAYGMTAACSIMTTAFLAIRHVQESVKRAFWFVG